MAAEDERRFRNYKSLSEIFCRNINLFTSNPVLLVRIWSKLPNFLKRSEGRMTINKSYQVSLPEENSFEITNETESDPLEKRQPYENTAVSNETRSMILFKYEIVSRNSRKTHNEKQCHERHSTR
jgi:hypothetical protein